MRRDSPNAIQEAPQARGFFCCSRMLREQDKSRAIRCRAEHAWQESRPTFLRHAEFEERGIQLFLVTQSDEFAESRKFARVVRGSIARREATHKTSTATEFFDFFRNKLFVMEACFENAVMEHRINVQRDGREDRGNRYGDKHFQERKAVSRSFRLS